MGTKINGQNAAPIFQLVVAQYRVGKLSCEILNASSMYAFPDPYAPAGNPNKIDLLVSCLEREFAVCLQSDSSQSVYSHDTDGDSDSPLVSLGPVEGILRVIRSIPIYHLSPILLGAACRPSFEGEFKVSGPSTMASDKCMRLTIVLMVGFCGSHSHVDMSLEIDKGL